MSNRGLGACDYNGLIYYRCQDVNNEKIKHFFSTRVGGENQGEFSNLNLGVYTNDNNEAVEKNFKTIFKAAAMELNRAVYLKQVHGDRFYVVDNENFMDIKGKYGDALITRTPNISIGVFTADCVPILVFDENEGAVAAVHAGWKGTDLKILKKVISHMIEEMKCSPKNIRVALGPSIGPCCFEVMDDVAGRFTETREDSGRLYVNLWEENRIQALEAGIPDENIISGKLCTMCNEKLFFSYRRDNGNTGRMASFIQLTKEV